MTAFGLFRPTASPSPAALLAVCLLSLLCLPLQAQQQATQAELERINAAIDEVRDSLRDSEGEHQALEAELRESEQSLAGLNRRIDATGTQLVAEQARLERLRRRSQELEAETAAQRDTVARYLRSAWQTGRQEYMKLLLNQESIDRSARVLQYYRYFSQARARRISAFKATLAELEGVRSDIAASTRVLEQRRADLVDRRRELEAGRQRRQAVLAELERAMSETGSELARLEREKAEIAVLLEELRRSIAARSLGGQQPFAEMKGRLPWPVAEPRLLNSYGARYSLGDLNWQGVTIAAEPGEEVRAIHHGRVVYADWFSSSGLLLIIDHGDGYMSLYAHNQLLYKEVGDWVNSGELIAAAGDTGGRRQAGVYFEIRYNGQSQDPIAWCVARTPSR